VQTPELSRGSACIYLVRPGMNDRSVQLLHNITTQGNMLAKLFGRVFTCGLQLVDLDMGCKIEFLCLVSECAPEYSRPAACLPALNLTETVSVADGRAGDGEVKEAIDVRTWLFQLTSRSGPHTLVSAAPADSKELRNRVATAVAGMQP